LKSPPVFDFAIADILFYFLSNIITNKLSDNYLRQVPASNCNLNELFTRAKEFLYEGHGSAKQKTRSVILLRDEIVFHHLALL
jgi:hypothetical protein